MIEAAKKVGAIGAGLMAAEFVGRRVRVGGALDDPKILGAGMALLGLFAGGKMSGLGRSFANGIAANGALHVVSGFAGQRVDVDFGGAY